MQHFCNTRNSNSFVVLTGKATKGNQGEICSEIYVDLFVEAFENKRYYYALLLSFAGCLLLPNVKRLWVLAFNEALDFAI